MWMVRAEAAVRVMVQRPWVDQKGEQVARIASLTMSTSHTSSISHQPIRCKHCLSSANHMPVRVAPHSRQPCINQSHASPQSLISQSQCEQPLPSVIHNVQGPCPLKIELSMVDGAVTALRPCMCTQMCVHTKARDTEMKRH